MREKNVNERSEIKAPRLYSPFTKRKQNKTVNQDFHLPLRSTTEIRKRASDLKRRLSRCIFVREPAMRAGYPDKKAFVVSRIFLVLSHAIPHFGEEPPLTGSMGSGTVFMSGCSGKCLFCQNYQISQNLLGKQISPAELAGEFIKLQNLGCANINWVTPTPQPPFLLEAFAIAVDSGLRLPLIYNTNGYVGKEVLELLEGIVDVYLPDMKYAVFRRKSSLICRVMSILTKPPSGKWFAKPVRSRKAIPTRLPAA